MPSRKQLVSQIWIYRKRRDVIKKRYKQGERGAVVGGLTIKIKIWLGQIRRIDARNKKLTNLSSSINAYFDVDISSMCMDKKHKLARNVYYKYGVEELSGVSGRILANHINRSDRSLATNARRSFTRTFGTNHQHKQAYHSFKNYVKKR